MYIMYSEDELVFGDDLVGGAARQSDKWIKEQEQQQEGDK